MGTEFKNIILGGAIVYNVEKAGIKRDKNNNPIYCVWLKGGAYAEYPEQKPEPVFSYYAKDNDSGITHSITEKTYKSNKTKKDGREYTFTKEQDDQPVLSSEKVHEYEGTEYYQQVINGFKGIKLSGTENPDGIYISNTTDAEIVTDNDKCKDGVNILINCKNIKYQIQQGYDNLSRWVGYKKKNGYFAEFKDK